MSPLSAARYIDSATISSNGKQWEKKKLLIRCLCGSKCIFLSISCNQTVKRNERAGAEKLVPWSWDLRWANQWNLCVWERGGERGCGGAGVGWRPRVTITRSAHITHVASLWAMGCLARLGFWGRVQARSYSTGGAAPTVHDMSAWSSANVAQTLARVLKGCVAMTRKVSHSSSRGALCAHVDACAAGVSITCLFCSLLTDPPHRTPHSSTFRMRKEEVLKFPPRLIIPDSQVQRGKCQPGA